MPRFKLLIEYAGTRYSGWQIQKNARTVQGEIARAVSAVTGRKDFELYGSGRTDAGVHAMAHERRTPGRHQHSFRSHGAAPLSRAPRRRVAPLPLSDLPASDGVRQGV